MKLMAGMLVWLVALYLVSVAACAATLIEGEQPVGEAVLRSVIWPITAAIAVADHELAHRRGAQAVPRPGGRS